MYQFLHNVHLHIGDLFAVAQFYGGIQQVADIIYAAPDLRYAAVNVQQKLALKEALKKLEGTEIEKLLKEYNVI